MSYINRLTLINGQTSESALIEPTIWGVCNSSGDTPQKIVNLVDYALIQGVILTIRFTSTNTASNPTLNVNNTGNISIYYLGSPIASHMLINDVYYQFIYNGTNYELISAAAQWASPQMVYTDLSTDSTTSTIQGGSTSAEVLGVHGILGTANGGTGVSSHTANRIVWSTSATTLSASGNHYIDGSKLAVNSSSEPAANFLVQGTSIFSSGTQDDTTAAEYVKVGNMTTHFLSIGANGLQAYNISNETISNGQLELQPAGGILQIGGASNVTLDAHLYGTYNFHSSNGFNFSGISAIATNNYVPLWFSTEGAGINGQIANNSSVGIPAYTLNLSYNPYTNYLCIENGGINSRTTTLTISAATDLILNSGSNYGIHFKNNNNEIGSFNSNGQFIVGNSASITLPNNTDKLYIDGNSYLNGNLTLNGNLLTTSNTSLGSSTHRWSAIYVGIADSYGNAYEPIYWNNGVPEVVSMIQKQNFTIAQNTNSVTLSHSAYNTNTIVLTINISSGGEYLTAPLQISTAAGSLTITHSSNVEHAVSGYIITARGVELTQQGGQ